MRDANHALTADVQPLYHMHMRTNRVVVLFDDDEMQELREAAGDVPLSVYLRKRVIEPKYKSAALKASRTSTPAEEVDIGMDFRVDGELARISEAPRTPLTQLIEREIEAKIAAPVDLKRLLP